MTGSEEASEISETASGTFLNSLIGLPGVCPCHPHCGHLSALWAAQGEVTSPAPIADPGRVTRKWVNWGRDAPHHSLGSLSSLLSPCLTAKESQPIRGTCRRPREVPAPSAPPPTELTSGRSCSLGLPPPDPHPLTSHPRHLCTRSADPPGPPLKGCTGLGQSRGLVRAAQEALFTFHKTEDGTSSALPMGLEKDT